MFAKVLLALVITLSPTYALADNITFDAFNEFPMNPGAHIEGLFTYQLSVGNAWNLSNSFGNPVSGLVTIAGDVAGSTLDIFLTAGGLFTFNRFDIACAACASNDPPFSLTDPEAVDFIGKNGAATTFTLANQFSIVNHPTYATINSPSSSPIDRLQIRISRAGTGRQVLDNINLTPLPRVSEPSSLLMLISALASLGVGLSRTKKK